jgi:poly(beta-D-mannuronate) lyase
VENPASFTAITPVRQELFPWTLRNEPSRVEPCYARFRDSRLPAIIAPRRPFGEWRLGVDVTAVRGAPLPSTIHARATAWVVNPARAAS